PADLPRAARHVLGPDRDGRLGRQGDRQPESGRRRRRAVRLAAGRARGSAQRHGHLVLLLAVRARRFPRAGVPRPADEPGAKPVLHRSRRLAVDHRARSRCRGRPAQRGAAGRRVPRRHRAAEGNDRRGRVGQGGDRRHGQPGRGDPRPRQPHAHRAADDPRLGRFPGGAAARHQAPARAPRARGRPQSLEHDPEKWAPVFGERSCSNNKVEVVMALARARRERTVEYWPGFVDALSTLVLCIVFLLSTCVVVQFYLSQEVTGKDVALARLNAQIAELTELLSMEKTGKASLEEILTTLRAGLTTAEGERDRFKGLYEGLGSGAADAQGKVTALGGQLDAEKQISARALAQVELLNQQIAALRRQLAALA